MDTITKQQRSINMSKIRSKNTSPEVIVRKILLGMGFRYRLHLASLPGKPDVILKKYKTAIFINGCFWHQHKNCKRSSIPKSNKDYWVPKLENNIQRQKENISQLKRLGWKPLIIWECEVKKIDELTQKLSKISD